VADVASGANTIIAVSNLPTGCVAAPASSTVSIPAGGTLTQDFVATCPVPVSALSGTITSSLGGALRGVMVTVTPSAGSATPPVSTDTLGFWSVSNLPYRPDNSGTITLSNVPAGCTNASPYRYAGLSASGLVHDIVVTCTATPTTYPLNGTWGAITQGGSTGRQVTLTVAIDMGAAPGDPQINGTAADDLSRLTFQVAYNGVGLDFIARTVLAPSHFDLATVTEVNEGAPTAVAQVSISSSLGVTRTGAFDLVRLTFNIAAGFSGTITPSIAITSAFATAEDVDVTSRVIGVIAPLIVP
jgi:hypothetical protein